MIYIKGLKDEKRSNFKMRFEKESKMRQWFRAVSIGIEIANRWPGDSTSSPSSLAPALSPSSSFRDAQICKRIMEESVNSGHMTKDEYDSMWFHEILSRVGKEQTEEKEEDSEDSMDNNDEDDGEEEDEKYQLCVRSCCSRIRYRYISLNSINKQTQAPVALVVVSNKILTETIRRRVLRLPLRLLFRGT